MEISARTVDRDIGDLQREGVPIEGEAGVGHRLGAGFDLPPLMFTSDELAALVAPARLALRWVDPAMTRHVEMALGKILSALPPVARATAETLALYASAIALDDATRACLQTLREAVESRNKLNSLCRRQRCASERIVRLLDYFYWGKVWTFSAWCGLRNDLRGFPIDRIAHIEDSYRDVATPAG